MQSCATQMTRKPITVFYEKPQAIVLGVYIVKTNTLKPNLHSCAYLNITKSRVNTKTIMYTLNLIPIMLLQANCCSIHLYLALYNLLLDHKQTCIIYNHASMKRLYGKWIILFLFHINKFVVLIYRMMKYRAMLVLSLRKSFQDSAEERWITRQIKCYLYYDY